MKKNQCILLISVIILISTGSLYWKINRSAPQNNVLLITMDTTRADRLGCYGYAKAETPTLDALARNGILFKNAFAHVPLTLPSHANIMTGLLPPETGLRDNARGVLNPNIKTLAKEFKQRGYRTGAFIAAFVLDKQFGLSAGFDVYNDKMSNKVAGMNSFDAENKADIICDRALNWLKSDNKKPFFAWVHLYDPHKEYNPPSPYKNRHDSPYDGEIAFMDSQIARLLNYLKAYDLDENTLIIVCGDHGESLGEHNENEHGILIYSSTLHVPLIISLPNKISPATTDQIAGLSNIPATIAGILNWRKNSFPGNDLLSKELDYACYSESLFGFYAYNFSPISRLTTPHWTYIEAPEVELYDRKSDPAETNNLATTIPETTTEMHNKLSSLRASLIEHKAGAIVIDQATQNKLRSLGYTGGATPTASESNKENLNLPDPKKLIDSVHNARIQAQNLIDDKKDKEAIPLIESALKECPDSIELNEVLAGIFLRLEMTEKALPYINFVIDNSADKRPMLLNMANILMKEEKFLQAIEIYQEALSLPTSPFERPSVSGESIVTVNVHVNLGVCLIKTGKLNEAVAAFLKVLEVEPDDLQANNNLAAVYQKLGKNRLAIEQFRKTLTLSPGLLATRVKLGQLLVETSNYNDALQLWDDGLKLHLDNIILLNQVAWFKATCPDKKYRNGKEAVTLAIKLCEYTNNNNFQALDTLAAAEAEDEQFGKAVATAEKSIQLAISSNGDPELIKNIKERLKLYQESKPFHQDPDNHTNQP